MEQTGKTKEELMMKICEKCHRRREEQEKKTIEWVCPHCEKRIKEEQTEENYKLCPKCKKAMSKYILKKGPTKCECGGTILSYWFNLEAIVDVDTLLISSRHLYRMPYSLHEKSGLASIMIDPEKVLQFEREMAEPNKVIIGKQGFLDSIHAKRDEGKKLIEKALFYVKEQKKETNEEKKEYAIPEEAISEENFPPCIKKILGGMEDGRKRSVFILRNFLLSCGWGYEQTEKRLKEWNELNTEQLRDVSIEGNIRYQKQRGNIVLPPNCDKKMYYQDIRVCNPDALCKRITNPVNYAKIKAGKEAAKK